MRTILAASNVLGRVSRLAILYRPDRNHDADGDSNGTTIVIKR